MLLLQCRTRVDPERVQALVGKKGRREDFGLTISGDASVFKPDGERAMTLVKGGISVEAATLAYPFLHSLRKHVSSNRGAYSGEPRFHKIKKDGSQSKTNASAPVRSVVIGHIDRSPRYPFCNCLPLCVRDPEGWESCKPMIREVARIFEKWVPARYEAQLAACAKTHPAYVIDGSPFTTLTVNNTFAGGYHRDAGDFKPGFGVMAVLRRGTYRGCEIIMPAYSVAADLHDRDVILFDVHEVHGNAPITDAVGEEMEDYERISIVFYMREKMVECLAPDEERERAKDLRSDQSLHDGTE